MGATADRWDAALEGGDAPEAEATAWRVRTGRGEPMAYRVRLGFGLLGKPIGTMTREGFDEPLRVVAGGYGPKAERTALGTVPSTPEGRRLGTQRILDYYRHFVEPNEQEKD